MSPDRVAVLRAEADRLESASCTGVSARWCPVHGDCACRDAHDWNDSSCPLHATASSHAVGIVDR